MSLLALDTQVKAELQALREASCAKPNSLGALGCSVWAALFFINKRLTWAAFGIEACRFSSSLHTAN